MHCRQKNQLFPVKEITKTLMVNRMYSCEVKAKNNNSAGANQGNYHTIENAAQFIFTHCDFRSYLRPGVDDFNSQPRRKCQKCFEEGCFRYLHFCVLLCTL